MSSETVDVVEGMTKGALSFTKEEVKGWVYKFINRDLLWIGKKSTIEKIKENRDAEEWNLFEKYISNKQLRIIIQVGLTLRDLEKDPNERARIEDLLQSRYRARGLHIAHFVQNGFLGNYIGKIITEHISKKALSEELEDTLWNIDKYIVFISASDNTNRAAEILRNRIEVNLPKVLMLYSIKTAIKVAKQIKEYLLQGIIDMHYKVSDMMLEEDKYICFFIRDEDFYREGLAVM